MTGQLKGKAVIIWGGQNTQEEVSRRSKRSRMVRDCGKRKQRLREKRVAGSGEQSCSLQHPPLESWPEAAAVFQKAFSLHPCEEAGSQMPPLIFQKATLASPGRAAHIWLGSLIFALLPKSMGLGRPPNTC